MSDELMLVDAEITSPKKTCENPEEGRSAENETDSDPDYPSPRRGIQLSLAAGSHYPTFEELVQNFVEKVIKH